MSVIARPMTRGASSPFPAQHRWDSIAIACLVLMIWVGVLGGFVPDVVLHVQQNSAPYPLIVHVHAAVFTGWLVFLTIQVALVRTGRTSLHRRLGPFGAGLAVAMLVLGPATALYVQKLNYGTAAGNPPFLAIQFTDLLAFIGPVAAGLLLRKDAAAHKRLMLLGTVYITDAGFGRMFAIFFPGLGGGGWWGFFVEGPLQPDILILALGAYDLLTRRRLHPVYLPAVAWLALMQASSIVLYFNPTWGRIAEAILGH